jgi:hypothetical protein
MLYCCDSTDRRAMLIAAGFRAADGTPLNAIDYLEVIDGALDSRVSAADDPRQRLLLVRLLQPPGSVPGAGQVTITGGTRVTRITCQLALGLRAAALSSAPLLSTVARKYLQDRLAELEARDASEPDQWLVVLVDTRGDYSPYRLQLVDGVDSARPPAGFDPVLSQVRFHFKVECPSDFDCEAPAVCEPSAAAAPPIDYLARDYQSFRRLMLDRLSVLVPGFREQSPADLGVTLVELLAYAADRAAYFQDGVATEAYLETARLRTSVRRHARLLDYRVHEGCNARAWVQLELGPGQRIAASSTSGQAVPPGTRFLSAVQDVGVVLRSDEEARALERDPVVFEALSGPKRFSAAHNEIRFHTWGEKRCVLPKGATAASLTPAARASVLELEEGDVLILEEVRHPETGQAADADATRRHAVRILTVEDPTRDPLDGVEVWEVSWHPDDALPFSLCLWQVTVERELEPVSVARGNVVLADHGHTRASERLTPPAVPLDGRYRPRLEEQDLTWRVVDAVDPARSARASLLQEARSALPALTLRDGDEAWIAVDELLSSNAFSREFVAEMEDDGTAFLRFGDGVLGRRPAPGVELLATYRTGRGAAGNLGAEAIRHVVSDALSGVVRRVRNPLPAQGGVDAEALPAVKLQAPAAFRVQERAVTESDWAEVAERHPAVQRAVATLRWTGSWNTVFLTVDPLGGRAFDAALEADLRAHLEPYRLAGMDLELRPPRYVPLDLGLVLCVSPEHFAHEVRAAVADRLTSGVRRDGAAGCFHPDRLSFGQPIYLSPIVAEVMSVPGVLFVDLDPVKNGRDAVRFQRLRQRAAGELEAGVIELARLEVARLDNDPNAPDNGRCRLTLRGGR